MKTAEYALEQGKEKVLSIKKIWTCQKNFCKKIWIAKG